MKKMRFFLMSAMTCMVLFATMSLTSCNKEDVTYNENDEAVLFMGVDEKISFPCPICTFPVAPQHYHVHYVLANECPLGPGCTHYYRNHWHIFQNHTGSSSGGTWLELTTHFGGTLPASEGDHEGSISL